MCSSAAGSLQDTHGGLLGDDLGGEGGELCDVNLDLCDCEAGLVGEAGAGVVDSGGHCR